MQLCSALAQHIPYACTQVSQHLLLHTFNASSGAPSLNLWSLTGASAKWRIVKSSVRRVVRHRTASAHHRSTGTRPSQPHLHPSLVAASRLVRVSHIVAIRLVTGDRLSLLHALTPSPSAKCSPRGTGRSPCSSQVTGRTASCPPSIRQ